MGLTGFVLQRFDAVAKACCCHSLSAPESTSAVAGGAAGTIAARSRPSPAPTPTANKINSDDIYTYPDQHSRAVPSTQ